MSRTFHDLSVWNKPLIDTCQYCSTSRAIQALHSLTNAGFQNRGVCLQAFFPSFPSPSPSPLFHFLALFSFLAWPTRESRSSVFLCSETKPKRLLRRLVKWVLHFLRLGRRRNLTPVYSNIFEAASISLFWAQQITQQITGNAFQISLERDWQIDSGFFNRPIMARTLA